MAMPKSRYSLPSTSQTRAPRPCRRYFGATPCTASLGPLARVVWTDAMSPCARACQASESARTGGTRDVGRSGMVTSSGNGGTQRGQDPFGDARAGEALVGEDVLQQGGSEPAV